MRAVMFLALALLGLMALGALVVVALGPDPEDRKKALRRELTDAHARNATYRVGLDHLRELVWQHRDIAPDLATITLDEIRRLEGRAEKQIGL